MSKEESFDEWYSNTNYVEIGSKFCGEDAWNHQQEKLDKANEKIKKIERSNDFELECSIWESNYRKLESENAQLKQTIQRQQKEIEILANGFRDAQSAVAILLENDNGIISEDAIERVTNILQSTEYVKAKQELEKLRGRYES